MLHSSSKSLYIYKLFNKHITSKNKKEFKYLIKKREKREI
jgi:hypothetical protein